MHSCGECTLCCTLLGIAELDKPPEEHCPNCELKVGCKIYEERPQSCRNFDCIWLQHEDFPADFRPDRINAVYYFVNDQPFEGQQIDIIVKEGSPAEDTVPKLRARAQLIDDFTKQGYTVARVRHAT